MTAVRVATGVLVVFTLTGCAGDQVSVGSSAPAPAPIDASMTGRWILGAPNSPSCGLEFGGSTGARNGAVRPDGGCPGNFYMSRRWAMEGSVLTIADDENQPLAQLRPGGARFEGQSTNGIPVTLER
jgi:Protease inhibitor Inh